jgi:ABC-type Fe3+-siderophore transport system permease subunit
MNKEDAQIKLGIYFAAVNLGSILLASLVLIKFGIIAGVISFIGLVTIMSYLIQQRARKQLEKENTAE